MVNLSLRILVCVSSMPICRHMVRQIFPFYFHKPRHNPRKFLHIMNFVSKCRLERASTYGQHVPSPKHELYTLCFIFFSIMSSVSYLLVQVIQKQVCSSHITTSFSHANFMCISPMSIFSPCVKTDQQFLS